MDLELGPKMLACNERERRFVWEFLQNGCRNASDAARKAGFSDPGTGAIRVWSHKLRYRPRVIEAMQEVARQYFGGMVLPAVLAAERMVLNEKHPDHAKMLLAVLSANGLGERTRVEMSVSGSLTVNHTDAALEDLASMIRLGVPREKLEETFGYSGLARYERMLAERDGKAARRPALIEGEVVKE